MDISQNPVWATLFLSVFFVVCGGFLVGAFRDISFKNGTFRPHTRALYNRFRDGIVIREEKLFFFTYFTSLIWNCFFLCLFVALAFSHVYTCLAPARPMLTAILLKSIVAGIFWELVTQGALLIQTWFTGLDFKNRAYKPYGAKKMKKCKNRLSFFLRALLPMILMSILALFVALLLIAFAFSTRFVLQD